MDDAQYNHLKNIYDKGKGRYVLVYGVLGGGLTFAILFSLIIPLVDPTINFGLLFPIMLVLSLPACALLGMSMWKSIEKQYLPVKHIKDEQVASAEAAKKESEAAKKASEERKKELIKKYGEEDGMLIFKRKISETNYKKKKEVIKKYGEEDGMSIFEGEISLKNYKAAANWKKELIKKYGEKFGLAVFEKKVHKGMSLAMVEDAIGKHKYKDGNDYYFGKPFNRKIVIVKDEVIEDKPFKDGIWIDMPKKMLTASWGRAGEKKETVTKSSIKQRLFYNGRKNRQGGKSFEYQVDVEDDLVVGWKELE